MRVYRISLAIYSTKLLASGNPARWNSKDVKMIYTAQSRALACLENIVHRDSKGLQKNFRIMEIDIPDKIKIEKIQETDLIPDWKNFYNMPYTQQIGNDWINNSKTAVLQVPSVIVSGDFNYLVNPAHKDFSSIKLLSTVPFEFDSRIKKEV
ncbi:MAG: RES family NAD+ phosphorylase [Ginsengibacter sp.]